MFGGAVLGVKLSNTLKSEVGGGTKLVLFGTNKFAPKLKGAAGGQGGGGCGLPSKKSSNVGNVSGAPPSPGPERSGPLPMLLLLLLLLLLLFLSRRYLPYSRTNLFLISNSLPG